MTTAWRRRRLLVGLVSAMAVAAFALVVNPGQVPTHAQLVGPPAQCITAAQAYQLWTVNQMTADNPPQPPVCP